MKKKHISILITGIVLTAALLAGCSLYSGNGETEIVADTPSSEQVLDLQKKVPEYSKEDVMMKDMHQAKTMKERPPVSVQEIDETQISDSLVRVTNVSTIGAVVQDSKDGELLLGRIDGKGDLLPYYITRAFKIAGTDVVIEGLELFLDDDSVIVRDGEIVEQKIDGTPEKQKVCDSTGSHCEESRGWVRTRINGKEILFLMEEIKEITFANNVRLRMLFKGGDDFYFAAFSPEQNITNAMSGMQSSESATMIPLSRNTVQYWSEKDPMGLRTMLSFKPVGFLLPHPSTKKEAVVSVKGSELSFKAVTVFDPSDEAERSKACAEDTLSKICSTKNGLVVNIGGKEVLLPEGELLVADIVSAEGQQRLWISAEKVGISSDIPSTIYITQFQPTYPKDSAISIKVVVGDAVESTEKNSLLSEPQKQAKRLADLQAISNFIIQYKISENTLPFDIPQNTSMAFCRHGAMNCTGFIDARDIFYSYNKESFPVDPDSYSDSSTGYVVSIDAYGKTTVSAPNAPQKMFVTK